VLTLDSLVDVVTNINGMLLLLAVFTTLLALGKTYRVGFPVARSSEKAPVFFECRDNRVFPIEDNGGYSSFYHIVPRGNGTMLLPKGKEGGKTIEALKNPQAAFQKAIVAIDPAQQYAAFIVRPDSFEIFRAIRDDLRLRGIEIGWEPLPAERPMSFGPGGRKVKSQD
jgi:hypothetical protein